MTKRHFVLAAVLLGLVGGGGWVASQTHSPDTPTDGQSDAARRLTVTTEPLQRQESYRVRRQFTGQVVAARSSDLSFQLAGQLEEIRFDEGESVDEGMILARLDTRRLQASRKRLQAELLQAKAVLTELDNGSRAEDIRAAEAEVKQLTSESTLYKNRLDRAKALAERGSLTQDELDLARANWESIVARLDASEARRDEVVAGPRREQIDAQRAQVTALEASIAELDVQLEDSILKAPYPGTLSARLVDPGAVVTAGQPVLRLVEDQSLEFQVGLPVSAVSGLDAQSTLEVVIQGARVPAQFERKLPVLNTSTRTRTVILKLLSDEGIVHGQTGELRLRDQIRQAGYWVPNTALQEGIQGLWTCYIAAPESADEAGWTIETRDVEVLHVEEDRSFVRGTISDGERIVTSGLHRLVNNQPVQLTN